MTTKALLAGTALLLSGMTISSTAMAEGYSVSGSITYPGEGLLLLELVTESQFENGENGDYGIAVEANGESANFLFENVLPGDYVLQGFQDTNGNGELDEGAFGPTEPWVIHGYKPSAFSGPKFSKSKISVSADTNVDIALND